MKYSKALRRRSVPLNMREKKRKSANSQKQNPIDAITTTTLRTKNVKKWPSSSSLQFTQLHNSRWYHPRVCPMRRPLRTLVLRSRSRILRLTWRRIPDRLFGPDRSTFSAKDWRLHRLEGICLIVCSSLSSERRLAFKEYNRGHRRTNPRAFVDFLSR